MDGKHDLEAVTADSRPTCSLNDEWLKNNRTPPERGQIEERGFFLFGDGEKNACFESPKAILPPWTRTS